MNNAKCIDWPVIKIDLGFNPDNVNLSDFKITPTLEDCLSVFHTNVRFSGQIHLEIVEITIFELIEISGHKIGSKEDIFEATRKTGYQIFPNGFIYTLCAQQGGLVKSRLDKNIHYNILVEPFVHLFQAGATLSLLRDSDDSLCLSANSGFPSAIEPGSVWLMVKSLEVKQMGGLTGDGKLAIA